MQCYRRLLRLVALCLISLACGGAVAWAQTPAVPPATPPATKLPPKKAPDEPSKTPEKVLVQAVAADQAIRDRLASILEATTWYHDSSVEVRDGVVFLKGSTDEEKYKLWAGQLAENTQDVVAVVNRIAVRERAIWDFSSTARDLRVLAGEAVRTAPLFVLALGILVATWFAVRFEMHVAEKILNRHVRNPLVRQVMVRATAIPLILLGVYLMLHVAGLTQMAVTVIGGTGLIGLVIGIAFRDIAENFLASVLLSVQRPFSVGDLIEVNGDKGLVQRMNTRGTLLMTLDGNHVQVPNATIYKSVVRNFTANPNQRHEFVVTIDVHQSASRAQELIRRVLADHPAVLQDPEPMVLVDSFNQTTVSIKASFWFDAREHSSAKVRSSVLRLTKKAVQDVGMDSGAGVREGDWAEEWAAREKERRDGEREKTRQGKPLPPTSGASGRTKESSPTAPKPPRESGAAAISAEGGLGNEEAQIERQAAASRTMDSGTDLLAHSHAESSKADQDAQGDNTEEEAELQGTDTQRR